MPIVVLANLRSSKLPTLAIVFFIVKVAFAVVFPIVKVEWAANPVAVEFNSAEICWAALHFAKSTAFGVYV